MDGLVVELSQPISAMKRRKRVVAAVMADEAAMTNFTPV